MISEAVLKKLWRIFKFEMLCVVIVFKELAIVHTTAVSVGRTLSAVWQKEEKVHVGRIVPVGSSNVQYFYFNYRNIFFSICKKEFRLFYYTVIPVYDNLSSHKKGPHLAMYTCSRDVFFFKSTFWGTLTCVWHSLNCVTTKWEIIMKKKTSDFVFWSMGENI